MVGERVEGVREELRKKGGGRVEEEVEKGVRERKEGGRKVR